MKKINQSRPIVNKRKFDAERFFLALPIIGAFILIVIGKFFGLKADTPATTTDSTVTLIWCVGMIVRYYFTR